MEKRAFLPGLRGGSALLLGLLGLVATLSLHPADEKRLTIYSNTANYSLPVTDRNGREYVGLLEVMEPLGSVTARRDGAHWKFRFNSTEMELTQAKSRAKMRGREVDLGGPFVLENGRGLVPLASLSALLPRFVSGPVTFSEGSRRLFIGNVATHFTAELSHTVPQRLVMNFTAPVNPTIDNEPGKLRMVFSREPVVSPSVPTLTFSDKSIPSATYTESNGRAEITVDATVPVMASFSNEGRTITIAAAPQQVVAQSQPSAPVPPQSTPVSPTGSPEAVSPLPGGRYFFAVVDASHGGENRGVAFSDQLAEKDVTLAIARRLRLELETRGITTLVLRDSDINLSLDQRAIEANTARPVLYISVHAAADGRGIRLYSAMLPAGGDNNGPFLSWNTAQARFLPASLAAITGVAAECRRKGISVRTMAAPLRPLNNITAAAFAVEVAPSGSDVNELASAAYQQTVAATVANGVASVRDKLGAP